MQGIFLQRSMTLQPRRTRKVLRLGCHFTLQCLPPPPQCLASSFCMGVSKNHGPKYRSQNSRVLVQGHPQKIPILRTQPFSRNRVSRNPEPNLWKHPGDSRGQDAMPGRRGHSLKNVVTQQNGGGYSAYGSDHGSAS